MKLIQTKVMIKQALTLLLALGMLSSCSKDSSSDSAIDGNSVSKVPIAAPGMGKTPQNPIPLTEWKGDWKDSKNTQYQGKVPSYNPLEGYWILTAVDGKPTDQFLAYHMIYGLGIHPLTKKPAPGETPNFGGSGSMSYLMNDTQIKVRVIGTRDSIIYNYEVAADRSWMTLNDGSVTYTFGIYDYNGIFYWKGDWNSPKNPYYPIYEGKYNPPLGEWKLYQRNDRIVEYDEYYWFSENLRIWQYNPPMDEYLGYNSAREYGINDTGIYINSMTWSLMGYSTLRYRIEGDTLYLQGYRNNKLVPELSKLVRRKK